MIKTYLFQEIEEDKKRAEQEGMAVTSRRPKQDGLTITITKAHNVSAASKPALSPAGPPQVPVHLRILAGWAKSQSP